MKNYYTVNQYSIIEFQKPVKKEFISVIIPVYKDAYGLKDTLESLSKQSCPKHQYEIIVANDGGDPSISKLCKEYKVYEVKLFPNKGSYTARNKALENAKGEYLAFTDADTIVPNNWLEKGKEQLRIYDYIGGPIKFSSSDNLTLSEKYENKYEFNIKKYFKFGHYCVTANLFTKRAVLQAIGGFDRRLQSGGDNEFGTRVYTYTKFKQKFDENNYVMHPHRNYSQIIKKKHRVIKGANDLIKYFPDRYNKYKFVLIDAIIQVLKPPFNLLPDIPLLIFSWYMKLIELFLNIRYNHKNLLLINEESKYRKLNSLLKLRGD